MYVLLSIILPAGYGLCQSDKLKNDIQLVNVIINSDNP